MMSDIWKQRLLSFLKPMWHLWQRPWFVWSGRNLVAFYDWKVSAVPSFHAIYFAAALERQIRRGGFEAVTVVFVPHGDGSCFEKGPRECNELSGEANHEWRFRNLVMPAFSLLSIRPELFICRTRAAARRLLRTLPGKVLPRHYTVRWPDRMERGSHLVGFSRSDVADLLHSSSAALDYAARWMEQNECGRNAICITLREASFSPSRNSDRAVLKQIAQFLKAEGYAPFFVPDTESGSYADLADVAPVFHAAPWNLELRVAALEHSCLGVFPNGGPLTLPLYLSDCKYLAFGMVDDESAITLEWQQEYYGLDEQMGAGYFGDGQRWVAGKETLNLFKQHFGEFRERGWVAAPQTR